MPADTTVKFIHSGMTGAPTLSGQAGQLIGVLDAALVNGFGLGTLDSLVIASNVATATRAAGHPFEVGSVALIAGATVSGGTINGEHRVTSVTATTYTFETTGLSNQTATGTITHKVAPAGWAKPYAGTNLAAYKPTDVTATGCLLRVDDTAARAARVVGYESMTDVSTGVSPFPTAAQVSGGGYWPKSSASDSSVRSWIVVGDTKMFYLLVAFSGSSTSYSFSAAFGDISPFKSGDAFHCVINFATSDISGATPGTHSSDYESNCGSSVIGTYAARPYTALGSSVGVARNYPTFVPTTGLRSGESSGGHVGFPNPADGGLFVVKHFIYEPLSLSLRGESPGFYCSPQRIGPSVFASKDSVTGVTGLAGRLLKAVNSNLGVFFFDITGPWR